MQTAQTSLGNREDLCCFFNFYSLYFSNARPMQRVAYSIICSSKTRTSDSSVTMPIT